MRFGVVLVCLLLAGCSAKDDADADPPEDVQDTETPVDGGAANGSEAPAAVADANVTVRSEVLYQDDVDLVGSIATGLDQVHWAMGIRTEVDVPEDADFTGILLEVYWGAPTGGVVGGKAGYWAEDLPDGGVDAETLGVAVAAGGESGSAWVEAQSLWDADNPEFTVAAGDGPHHAAFGTASVAATAFFGGTPPEGYTAL